MLSGKSRAEQVEVIKQLIRQFNYRENQKIYDHCVQLGLSVNMQSLSRFSEKLELLDRAERQKQAREQQSSGTKKMTYAQVKQRETEITFELGELKIREHKLLEELNSLSTLLDVKQFN
tara:strand:+ start:3126 stop:3482 length:357 start_codon:yes stop_codon:yes gene_type:complete